MIRNIQQKIIRNHEKSKRKTHNSANTLPNTLESKVFRLIDVAQNKNTKSKNIIKP